MIKLLTLVAFLSAQIAPFQSFAQERVVNEFEKSAKDVEQEVAKEKAAKEKKERVKLLRSEVRDSTIVLAARVEELETLAEQIPNVREDVIEDSARTLREAELEDNHKDVFGVSAVIAVASGLVYALTKYDVPKAVAHLRVSQAKPVVAPRVKTTKVNNALRSVYGNKIVARTAGVTGVLAAIVAGVAYVDSKTMSLDEMAAIESLENTYLSNLVTGGQASHLTEDQIEDALTKKYNEDPAFREAVLAEVRTIVSETQRLNAEISNKKQEIAETLK